ncbi:gamma-glutamyl-gamma-aminobutyrate hydrolase family protein [Yaniella halotolerans]|uniref:gamma-glutamyl-gamma-aminobutyrate hydrolase family protein n=1 Tax=Yaniella halotolerans TaxID=225453 RepID=UPI0003B3AD49|nr:gamma-glutamyl-gamma-aminobutyrate hydrolase family protein [Yaniella halotolerans]
MNVEVQSRYTLADYQIDEDYVLDERPAIAVVVALWSPDFGDAEVQTMHDLTLTSVQEVRDAGGRPVVIDSSDPAQQLSGTTGHDDIDAFIYLGGADVHPGFFSDADLNEKMVGVDANADQFCLQSLQHAIEGDAPVLGICRGSQLLNVALGGSIIQHIDGHRPDDGEGFVDENLRLEPNSKISGILGRHDISVRGSHHQSIDEIGAGLAVTAYAPDGTIEGTEHREKTWVVGLQWHPEEANANAEDRQKIFGALVAQAAKVR